MSHSLVGLVLALCAQAYWPVQEEPAPEDLLLTPREEILFGPVPSSVSPSSARLHYDFEPGLYFELGPANLPELPPFWSGYVNPDERLVPQVPPSSPYAYLASPLLLQPYPYGAGSSGPRRPAGQSAGLIGWAGTSNGPTPYLSTVSLVASTQSLQSLQGLQGNSRGSGRGKIQTPTHSVPTLKEAKNPTRFNLPEKEKEKSGSEAQVDLARLLDPSTSTPAASLRLPSVLQDRLREGTPITREEARSLIQVLTNPAAAAAHKKNDPTGKDGLAQDPELALLVHGLLGTGGGEAASTPVDGVSAVGPEGSAPAESAAEAAAPSEELDTRITRGWFARLDPDGSESVTFLEFRDRTLRSLRLFQSLDSNGDGVVDFREFATPVVLTAQRNGHAINEQLLAWVSSETSADEAAGPSPGGDARKPVVTSTVAVQAQMILARARAQLGAPPTPTTLAMSTEPLVPGGLTAQDLSAADPAAGEAANAQGKDATTGRAKLSQRREEELERERREREERARKASEIADQVFPREPERASTGWDPPAPGSKQDESASGGAGEEPATGAESGKDTIDPGSSSGDR